jgi:hypothetical protein
MPPEEPPKSESAANDAATNGGNADNGQDFGHEDAAEILTNLLQNQAATTAGDNGNGQQAAATAGGKGCTTQVGEAQQAAIQQMMQQLKLGGVSLPNAAAEAAGGATGDQEKKHAFWDTQVRGRSPAPERLRSQRGALFASCLLVLPNRSRGESAASWAECRGRSIGIGFDLVVRG